MSKLGSRTRARTARAAWRKALTPGQQLELERSERYDRRRGYDRARHSPEAVPVFDGDRIAHWEPSPRERAEFLEKLASGEIAPPPEIDPDELFNI